MQPTTTGKFSVSFPPLYNHVYPLRESIMAEHKVNDKCVSYIHISPIELSSFNDYEGHDLLTRFQAFCLDERGTVEVIEDKTLQVKGVASYIRTAQAPGGSFYYFGLLPFSGTKAYLFIGDCEAACRQDYEPLFNQIWQSLRHNVRSVKANPISYPPNGAEFWKIGHFLFTLSTQPECYISDSDGALYVKVEASAPRQLLNGKNNLLNSYDAGKVYLQFYFKGIYKSGIPTGKFHFENESNSSYLTYVWKGGFQYSQRLTADVTLQDGWLTIDGHFNESPFRLAVKLPLENINWNNYRFLSTSEVNTAPPDIVHKLSLTDVTPGILQETLKPLMQLQALSIDYRNEELATDFTEIPNAVNHLSELKELSISNVSALISLPQWMGQLKKLETFRLQNSKVEEIHAGIFQLPVLKKLYLGGNQLRSIPDALPISLETLILSGNKLNTVPQSVTKLQYLNIEDNPLLQLPGGLADMPGLSLEMGKKVALLDYSYKGADGKGTVAYDDNRFFAKYDPGLLSLLEEQITANELGEFKEGLTNRALRSVAFETTEEDAYAEKGNHRFGGLPDLPTGVAYPTFIDWEQQEKGLQFIAQINCTAIAHLQDYLPRTGILYFFVKDHEEMGPKVLYYNGDSNELQSAKELNIDNDFIFEQNGIYTPFRAEAGKYASIPFTYNAHSLYPELAEMDDMYEKTEQLKAGLAVGSAQPVHGINSYVFKHHGTPETEAVEKMKGKPEDWIVLLRVSSDNSPGFCFWDSGEIYFVIHKSDLDKKDFSNVYCGLESS